MLSSVYDVIMPGVAVKRICCTVVSPSAPSFSVSW